jgi:hypothetical protein
MNCDQEVPLTSFANDELDDSTWLRWWQNPGPMIDNLNARTAHWADSLPCAFCQNMPFLYHAIPKIDGIVLSKLFSGIFGRRSLHFYFSILDIL